MRFGKEVNINDLRMSGFTFDLPYLLQVDVAASVKDFESLQQPSKSVDQEQVVCIQWERTTRKVSQEWWEK